MRVLFYLSGENAAEAVRVYRRNHKLKRDPCSVKNVHNLVKTFEEIGCTCSRSRSRLPHVPVKIVAEVHNMMTVDPLHAARIISHNLDVPKLIVFQILLSILRVFPYRFQCVQVLES